VSNFIPNKGFFRGGLLHYIKMTKKAAESQRILLEVYAEHAPVRIGNLKMKTTTEA